MVSGRSKQASIDTHTHMCNAVTLVWGSLKLAPINMTFLLRNVVNLLLDTHDQRYLAAGEVVISINDQENVHTKFFFLPVPKCLSVGMRLMVKPVNRA